MHIKMNQKAEQIIRTLQSRGFEAYAVGGCVRDAMLGLEPHDWDICTNARPGQLREVFRDFPTYDYGLKHGTLTISCDGEPFEVTTYRIDGVYRDNRHPECVSFTGDLTLDLSRRDFTVNAMAYSDETGLVDPFGGEQDLRSGVLRCVGDPGSRFREDALRILRGLRFAACYGFQAEKATDAALRRDAHLLNHIAAERVCEELTGMLCGTHIVAVLTAYRGVFAQIIPELVPCFDFPQRTPHHCFDVWAHIVHSVGAIKADPCLRMTMLLHDIGKPQACTVDAQGANHFKGHQQISTDLAKKILRRLRFPKAFAETCLQLILYHDVRFDGSQQQVKRILGKLGEENMRLLFAVQRADIAAQSDFHRAEKLAGVELAQRQAEDIIAQNRCFRLKDLAVNGSDLLALGIPVGAEIGKTLHALLDAVIDGALPNEKEPLLKAAADRYRDSG